MFGRTVGSLLLFAGAALAGGQAHAWGPDGHAIVAAIAEERLDPQVRARVGQILSQDHPQHQHLDEVASWADDYRGSHRETKNWHFVDIPLHAKGFNDGRDCAGGDCVVYHIRLFAWALGNPQTTPDERLKALKFLVHFVGDVHQPLHCETDFSKYPPPEGDQGGNKIHVTYFGDPYKFHSLWDGGIIDDALNIERGDNDYTPRFEVTRPTAHAWNSAISAIKAATWAPPGSAADDAGLKVAVIGWANESHGLAQIAYAKLPPSPRKQGWDQVYHDYAWPVIQDQLSKGGVRLARILNEALR